MIGTYFTKTVTLSRSTVSANKTTYQNVGTITCHIQPMSDKYQHGSMGRDSKDFMLFSTQEVRIGDRIVEQSGRTYEVYGAKQHEFRGRSHYECTLRSV